MKGYFKSFKTGYVAKNKQLFLTLISVIVGLLSYSQQYPVQVVPQILPPYSVQLSEYYTGALPKFYVTITNTDVLQASVDVYLRLTIKSGSTIIARSSPYGVYPPINLRGGAPVRLSGAQLEPYFNPGNLSPSPANGKLPEGFYEFSFEAIEVNTGRLVSRTGSCYAAISLNEVPVPLLPAYNSQVVASNPTTIVFTWSNPSAAFTSDYEFQLVEVL